MRTLIAILTVTFQVMAADPRLGIWRLVSARSTQDPPRIFTTTAGGDGVHSVGSIGMEYTARYDGRPYPLLGLPVFDHVALHRMAKDAVMVFYSKDGMVIETDRLDYSGDGNEMVETNSFILPSRPDLVWVWDRTGGARDPSDPDIGEWTRSLSKSRMRQGLVLTIESDDGDGVHFVGDSTYIARPDGMDYPVREPRFIRADTVALQFVDAHTVVSIYKRGGKVAAQDRWVVSGDGKRMTATSDGTQMNGARIHEDLVFEKQ